MMIRNLNAIVLLVTVIFFMNSAQAFRSSANRPVLQNKNTQRPNIVLVMADDMGWGQTGYRNHPALKTLHLDQMAKSGIRFDRFYAGAPNCSPTRATVMTGRTNDRTGVFNHGVALRPQEITVAKLLQQAGYRTAHFGKWHLNGLRGPGVPILKSDIRHPGHFGFDRWLSVSNFFDRDPILSREGFFEEFVGDSSEVIVQQATKFIEETAAAQQPSFTVIWFGSPHSPFKASESDQKNFQQLKESSAHHYGELVAMDRSIGSLRSSLKELNIANNTLVWFCSDNGGLSNIQPDTVGGLRGYKNSVYEGGLRVPCVVEWPNKIQPGQVTNRASGTVDILPTLLDVIDRNDLRPQRILDGESLKPILIDRQEPARQRPLGFRHTNRFAWLDYPWKLVKPNGKKMSMQLFHLDNDPQEKTDLSNSHPEKFRQLKSAAETWLKSVDESVAGKDYPEGRVFPADPKPKQWTQWDAYQPFLPQLKQRWEYKRALK